MCEEGWCVGLGQEGVAWGWGNFLKYLKRGGGVEQKRGEGRGNKDFKKAGKLGQGMGALKGWGVWNHLTTMKKNDILTTTR